MELSNESELLEELNNLKDISPNLRIFQENALSLISSTKEINKRIPDIENGIKEIEKDFETTLEQEKSARSDISIQKLESEIKECKEKEISFQEENQIKKEMVCINQLCS